MELFFWGGRLHELGVGHVSSVTTDAPAHAFRQVAVRRDRTTGVLACRTRRACRTDCQDPRGAGFTAALHSSTCELFQPALIAA